MEARESHTQTDTHTISLMHSDPIGSNKDHQRMIVDPMFMSVHNLGLFLTALTPTAVAPTADQF